MAFTVLTVGWDPAFAVHLLGPVAARTGIDFVHGLVGDARRLPLVRDAYPDAKWVALGNARGEPLPAPDVAVLASIEGPGVPTVRSMLRGDPVVRHRDPEDGLGYATLLVHRIATAIDETAPDVILANFDNVHAAIALGVARSRNVPWVALAFSVIPEHLTWFARAMTPEDLVPQTRPVTDELRRQAADTLRNYRAANVKIMAYRPPTSLGARARQMVMHGRNLVRRAAKQRMLGVDRFTFPTAVERVSDIARRTKNRLRFPAARMIRTVPDGRYVFFPLHMAPESSVDTWAPMYQNQIELAAQMALAVPADLDVVVKLHFSDPDNYSPAQLDRLLRLPRVRIAHPGASSRTFIEHASLVVGIQGTASLEAALMGKPVLLFGKSPYLHFPRSERARRPDELHEQVRRMLQLPPAADEEIVEAFATYIARYRPGRVNDWSLPLTEQSHDRFAECFRELEELVQRPGVRDTWYAQPPFAGAELGSFANV